MLRSSGTGRPRILSLESVDCFGTSEYLRENFDGIRAIIWLGVVHFNCMQTSLVMSTQFIFSDD